jgi:hypothetical protein
VPLNGLEIVDRGLGIPSAKLESRHVPVNGAQAALQSCSKVIIVKLAISERSKWRRINVRAPARFAHGVTPSAQRFEQVLSSLLLAIEGVTGIIPDAYRQKREASYLHGRVPGAAYSAWLE